MATNQTVPPRFTPLPPADGPVLSPDFANALPETTIARTGGRFTTAWYRALVAIIDRISALVGASLLQSTQATLGQLSLTANDVGQLVWVTDFNHVLYWNGTGFSWGPGEQGSGWRAQFDIAPVGPGWAPMDGRTVNYLQPGGAVLPITLANAPGFWFRQ